MCHVTITKPRHEKRKTTRKQCRTPDPIGSATAAEALAVLGIREDGTLTTHRAGQQGGAQVPLATQPQGSPGTVHPDVTGAEGEKPCQAA